jgi:antitoxin component of MazEF toxin-antitoxin module
MQKLRKQGNSLGITIPREELDRLGLVEGDLVAVDINRLEVRPAVSPELRTIIDRVLRDYREGIDYLRDK